MVGILCEVMIDCVSFTRGLFNAVLTCLMLGYGVTFLIIIIIIIIIILIIVVIIIIDNFCIALFPRVHKLAALYSILQHFHMYNNVYTQEK